MPSTIPVIASLLNSNARWAEAVSKRDANLFTACAKGQAPKVLWIGCADSRVPESIVLGCKPGDIFVHRNIANQFHPDDDSALSVLSYAVDVLGVEHIIVAGHTACGGAAACVNFASQGPKPDQSKPVTRWLTPMTSLAHSINAHEHPDGLQLLIEENVKMQVENVKNSTTVTSAWAGGVKQDVWVHGWVYDVGTGLVKDLNVSAGPPARA